jgi:hypothetical protein
MMLFSSERLPCCENSYRGIATTRRRQSISWLFSPGSRDSSFIMAPYI